MSTQVTPLKPTNKASMLKAMRHHPNAQTLEAIEDVRQGRNLSRPYDTVDELIKALHA